MEKSCLLYFRASTGFTTSPLWENPRSLFEASTGFATSPLWGNPWALFEASTGFEPVIRVLQTLALPLGHDAIKNQSGRWDSNPRPSPWQGDVLPLNHARKSWPVLLAESAESQNRTDDTAIFSRVLYQLSYLGRYSFVKRP